MVQVTVRGRGQLQCTEADVIERLIVNAVCLICVLNKLVNREGGIVGLNNGVRYFWRWHNRESVHNPVRVLLADFGDEKSAHSRPGATTERVCKLEALEAIAALCLFADNI